MAACLPASLFHRIPAHQSRHWSFRPRTHGYKSSPMSRQSRSRFPSPTLMTRSEDLAALCTTLRREPYVTIDTEFMRERTYWPELCVVQLGGADCVAVIDTLAPELDLAPLGELLADPAVIKVFHACRQDIEIFLLRFGAIPQPMFDTQVAAMVAGFGDQVGYDTLVSSLTGGHIDKAHRFSDWSRRPLSQAQIDYAAADVTHLRGVYETLRDRLEKEGRLGWVSEEMAVLNDPATYRTDPVTMWERLRPRTNNRRYLGLLRAICAWREVEAQRLNIPRQRLIKDESLLEIAATSPADAESLAQARGVGRGFAEGRSGATLLAAIAEARGLPDSDLPAIPRSRESGSRPSPALVSLLKVLLAAKSEQHNVAPKLLASSEDLDRLATEAEPDVPALTGWRRDVFGQDALALKNGEICLGVDGKQIKLITTA
ncbi:Ribonuclease D [Granulibacter bethesdensis]|nr:Ribonuclease D [Granulibacter bethesdensis]